ncbi:hypothetical protein VTN77DRAFT_1995 [Rasamsonia byssochlamydoides]|uniref:uncharacterized protein n=1 Tax=Rasamsonia byssochlamydoides TaxID=89139 RepID=UPI003742002F
MRAMQWLMQNFTHPANDLMRSFWLNSMDLHRIRSLCSSGLETLIVSLSSMLLRPGGQKDRTTSHRMLMMPLRISS